MTDDASVEKVYHAKCVDRCPACGARFVGMDLVEFRDNHAAEECPDSPLTVEQLCEAEYNGCRPGGLQNGL